MVGGSGALVNMLVVIILKKIGPDYRDIFLDLPLTDYNVRWYHVIVTIAFLVANFWNFWINRRWTFRSSKHASWYAEYPPFLAVGAIGQILSLGLITALIHSGSPLSLPDQVFDDSTGFRTKLYWAQLISIVLVTPVTYVTNKLWTFSAVRRGRPTKLLPIDGEPNALDPSDAPSPVDPALDPSRESTRNPTSQPEADRESTPETVPDPRPDSRAAS